MKIGIDTTFLVEASILEHPGHAAARETLDRRLGDGDVFVMAPQVVAELIHVITDSRRFARPLDMPAALETALGWWNARETERVSPTPESMTRFREWMKRFDLGRKRILDTMLAATYFSHDIRTILSTNARDYSVFGCFEIIVPGAAEE